MRKNFLVLINPTAGAAGNRLLPAVLAALRKAGAHVTAVYPSTASETRRLACEGCRTNNYDAIVAAGGDGTVRQVAAGVLGMNTPIGVIPTGTGNVLANEAGFKATTKFTLRTLLTGDVEEFHGGIVNDEPFFLMVGAGFDGRIVGALNRAIQHRVGKVAYTYPLLRALSAPLDDLRVVIDGVDYKTNWIVVSKARHYGGAFVLAPQTTIFTPGLWAILFNATTRYGLVSQLFALATGRLAGQKNVTMLPCAHVRVEASRPTPTQIDGDVLGITPLQIRSSNQKVALIVSAR
jgi:diacylglycerol kinase (ATP)